MGEQKKFDVKGGTPHGVSWGVLTLIIFLHFAESAHYEFFL